MRSERHLRAHRHRRRLRKYLEGTDDSALLVRRLDRLQRALALEHRDVELLSEAFGRYMRLWFLAHASSADAVKAAGRGAAEAQYKKFAQHLGAEFMQGHRFVDDVPVEASAGEDEVR